MRGQLWVLVLGVTGCTAIGDGEGPSTGAAGSGPNGDDVVVPVIRTSMAPDAQTIGLEQSAEFTISIESENVDGAVPLTLSSVLPASWNVDHPEKVVLASGTATDVQVTVTIPSNGEAGVEPLAFDVGSTPLSAELTVEDVLVLPIAAGVGDGQHNWPVRDVRPGTLIRFVNMDGTRHTVHSDNLEAGFPHQPDPGMAPSPSPGEVEGGDYEIVLNRAGNFQFYCHIHGPADGLGALIAE